jgi:hypothetical protein
MQVACPLRFEESFVAPQAFSSKPIASTAIRMKAHTRCRFDYALFKQRADYLTPAHGANLLADLMTSNR